MSEILTFVQYYRRLRDDNHAEVSQDCKTMAYRQAAPRQTDHPRYLGVPEYRAGGAIPSP